MSPAPMAPHSFHALLSLEAGPRHGYAIMMDMRETSGSNVGPGAVYGALRRLAEAGLVEEAGEHEPDRGGRPRLEYRITPAGREALREEAARMALLARIAVERRLIPGDGRS